jgi:hypothetical protein
MKISAVTIVFLFALNLQASQSVLYRCQIEERTNAGSKTSEVVVSGGKPAHLALLKEGYELNVSVYDGSFVIQFKNAQEIIGSSDFFIDGTVYASNVRSNLKEANTKIECYLELN